MTSNLRYPLDTEMIKAGVRATPAQLWKWGDENGNFFGKEPADLNELRYALLPQADRKVSKKGVRFNNHYYIGKDYNSIKFLDNNRWESILISYDPHDINYVYVKSPDGFLRLEISKKLSSTVLTFDDLEALVPEEEISDKYSKANLIYQLEQESREAARKNASTLTQRRKEIKRINQNRKEYLNELEKRKQKQETEDKQVFKAGTTAQTFYDRKREAFLEQKRKEREK